MKKGLVVAGIVCAGLVLVGCGTVAKQTYYGITGPTGDYSVLSARSPASLAQYTKIEVAPFENDIPELVEPILERACQTETVLRLQEDGFFENVRSVSSDTGRSSASDTLLISGKITDMTSEEVTGETAVKGGTHLISRVAIQNSAGDTVISAIVRGEVKSVATRGETRLAEGLGKGMLKLLEHTFQMKKEEE
jgi:hypothetical protein